MNEFVGVVGLARKRVVLGAGILCLGLAGLTGCGQEQASQNTTTSQNTPAATAGNTAQNTPQTSSQPMSKLTVAFASRKDATELEAKAKAVGEFLSKEMGMPVETVIGDDTAAVEALRSDKVDAAFLSSRPALKAEELAGSRLVLAEVRKDYSGGHTYNSVLVVKEDSPLAQKATAKETLEQLKDKKMAFASRTSGSGFIIPTGELVGQGLVDGPDRLENFFSQVNYGDGYSSALKAVLQDQADVAAVSEYALKPPYITEEEAAQLRVLHSIPGVPAHGITLDDDVPADVKEKFVNAMMKLNEPANNQLLTALYNSTELVKVDHDKHLAPMKDSLKRANMTP
ncbi:phosphate/phosphite/phosphonate ABC transporter substrate-binding protein [Ancylothrix sp. C2]|uniref:phosphate/phosphite/phosphonate ABC transporter substrate-binding protein n=1 Tax=Ancylothrix sp. D3o TaxID=2953691 RepID=UPI0021BBADE8|nr:phosphate/phosphite/phosphonate ABC transporter substrate-binding protein [Ancylothrix sp. D3o]MCT7949553.1 phosphate/phosphite/phosphonate ABC transporter substrate-binding protein [Ancylothrix sp. D3o]